MFYVPRFRRDPKSFCRSNSKLMKLILCSCIVFDGSLSHRKYDSKIVCKNAATRLNMQNLKFECTSRSNSNPLAVRLKASS